MKVEIKEYIEKFNISNADFGEIDINFILNENNDSRFLFFYYPMIERLVRNILYHNPKSDIEHFQNYTFKSLYSIVKQNYDLLNEIFREEKEEESKENEVLYYLIHAYKEDGPRNKFMHHAEGANVDIQELYNAKYFFERLIVFYVDNYC